MRLGDLITELEKADQDLILNNGFASPHSYRGSYECLAFEPKNNVPIKEMLKLAKGSLNKTFEGYKGGDFEMQEYTKVYLAEYGCCGESIGPLLLKYMINDSTKSTAV